MGLICSTINNAVNKSVLHQYAVSYVIIVLICHIIEQVTDKEKAGIKSRSLLDTEVKTIMYARQDSNLWPLAPEANALSS